MAKSRVSINPLYKGGAGGYTFYVRGGEQVVRQRKNNSNYGDTASRTMPQMLRRIRWGNLVNCYKAIASWQKKAYDSKVAGQTDYNIFMQLNINRVAVGETKEMCEGGCAVFESYQVSRGSLAPVDLSWDSVGSAWESSINYDSAITGTTTIGALSQVIMLNNPEFLPGDNIAIIFFKNYEAPRVEWPFASSSYAEITLDATSTALLSSIPELANRLAKNSGDKLSISARTYPDDNPLHEVGCVVIHTRKSASNLKVSSQSIVMADASIIEDFSGSAWDEVCINSYGITEDAPLEPSFKGAVIEKVAINGSEISNLYGRILTYNQPVTLVLTGVGMNSGNVYLDHNGVRYTPLVVDGDKWTFILGDNGTNRIYVNGNLYGGVAISGVEVPDVFPANISACLYKGDDANFAADRRLDLVIMQDVNCINYGHVVQGDFQNFIWICYKGGLDVDGLSIDGGEIMTTAVTSSYCTVNVKPTSPDSIVILYYEGFICGVLNYDA